MYMLPSRTLGSLLSTRNLAIEAIPLSIIPVVAKVFERIVYDQLYRYLTENKLLCCYQSGFRTLHSTVTALIEATDSGFVKAVVFRKYRV